MFGIGVILDSFGQLKLLGSDNEYVKCKNNRLLRGR